LTKPFITVADGERVDLAHQVFYGEQKAVLPCIHLPFSHKALQIFKTGPVNNAYSLGLSAGGMLSYCTLAFFLSICSFMHCCPVCAFERVGLEGSFGILGLRASLV
jgi:hypothetical protein